MDLTLTEPQATAHSDKVTYFTLTEPQTSTHSDKVTSNLHLQNHRQVHTAIMSHGPYTYRSTDKCTQR
jgi:hypothetical protein